MRLLNWFLVISDLVFAFLVAFSWYLLMTRAFGAVFTAQGLRNLRYFTVDSNLFLGLCMLICLVPDILSLFNPGYSAPSWVEYLRIAGVTGVTITLLVVIFFLGPVLKLQGLFVGSNLFMHLLTPLLAIISLLVTRSVRMLPGLFPGVFIGMLPMVLYGIYYAGNLLINGINGPNGSNDWYGFLGGDMSRFPVAMLTLLIFDFLLSLLLTFAGSVRPPAAS